MNASAAPRPVLPKSIPHGPPKPSSAVRVSPRLIEAARNEIDAVVRTLDTTKLGLAPAEAEARLRQYGPNVVAADQRHALLRLLRRALVNPLVILLVALAGSSFATGDFRAGSVMLVMVALGVVVRFVQEARADTAAAKLRAMISVHATVLRGGPSQELPVSNLVPGDVVELAAGDMIPADVRLLACKDLFVVQGSLTGEAFPVEKFPAREPAGDRSPLEFANVCYLGTSVESGTATAVVVATGLTTVLGGISSALVGQQPPSSFDRGMTRFTWLMIRFMVVMVPLVFVINGLTKGEWGEAFFFAMAVAVGMTPEMLPMIVAVCLSKGAMAMSRKKVIVKRLNAIQNLGAMDVLCTDKTGTLTQDRIILERYCDVKLKQDDDVLTLAYLNSHFQTGLRNLMDRAVLTHTEIHAHPSFEGYAKVDEIPFDFSRRMMSVVVQKPDGRHRLICKGAPEAVYPHCTTYELDGQAHPVNETIRGELRHEFDRLSADGFRVLAVAYRDCDPKAVYAKADEQGLTLRGYVAFLDPPKDSAREAIAALQRIGVAVKVLTGDNELVSRKICREVGIPTDATLLGGQVEALSDAELTAAAAKATLFARLSPAHKQRVIQSLQAAGHVVGFMGDGINDAPALRAADVGVSVDTAVDIAKESADVILLEKNLLVLEEGVREGRKVFANIVKYVRMGASSNFGNMFSVLGGSIFLPFVPMAPIQILTNNLLYDFSQVAIPTDDVDAEQIAKPRPWSMGAITRYILFIGPCSSVFDYVTFFVMLYAFGCWDPANAPLFQTAWFVESLLTQTLIIHVIRTNRIPFLQSRASWPLLATTLAVMVGGASLPFSPLGPYLGFRPLPLLFWPLLASILLGYVALTQVVKSWLFRKGWTAD
ncbi:magnesium-translocating P-type ATPase [Limnoglobus roseus]|uniref:Magnesium-transporting ATPase, P-type 1 n=1 Tax=Limnoglobus roseus TaxID=2598579 RepID=A0A5C1AMR8_9BACT|nr:magnesium-translocating P-type ATPase [Limnoglobus roseus]QEL19875.1 magnesium-translocating P-type ATPase [Limnoglobus roseus]